MLVFRLLLCQAPYNDLMLKIGSTKSYVYVIRKIPVTGKQAVKHRTHPQGGGGDTLKVQLKFCSGTFEKLKENAAYF